MLPLILTFIVAQPVPPNVILIMADDLSYGELGCYGQEKIKTPNLDRLAAEGMKFTRFYSASTVCAPTRASLLTGRHTGHSAIRGNSEIGGWGLNAGEGQRSLPASETTIAEYVKTKGYATGVFGKWGLGAPASEGRPRNQGFDTFFGYLCQRVAHNYTPTHLWQNDDVYILDKNTFFNPHQRFEVAPDDFSQFLGEQYSPTIIHEKSEDFIKANKDKPFFLYYATTIPHVALQAPKEWVDKYPREWDEKPYLGQNAYLPNERPRATYAAMVSYLDHLVGQLMDLVDELGLSDNTVFIFKADNGTAPNGGSDREFFNATAGLRGMKTNSYEGGLRVPFIARWKGKIDPGTTHDGFWSSYDVLPTITELAGAEIRGSIDGISFLPTLLGRTQTKKHDFLYFEFPEGAQNQAVISGRYKMIRPTLRNNPERVELYDIIADPNETKDLAKAQPDVLARLLAIAKKERVPNARFPIPALDNPGS